MAIMEKVLHTFTSQFDHIIVTIEETKYLRNIMIEDLQSTLEAYELKFERKCGKEEGQTILSQFKKLPLLCYHSFRIICW